MSLMMTQPPASVRGEPDYGDQVPRLIAWARAHPAATVEYQRPHWQALIPEAGGETVITRMSLRQLMDKLETL